MMKNILIIAVKSPAGVGSNFKKSFRKNWRLFPHKKQLSSIQMTISTKQSYFSGNKTKQCFKILVIKILT
jgi:hypothetical protein